MGRSKQTNSYRERATQSQTKMRQLSCSCRQPSYRQENSWSSLRSPIQAKHTMDNYCKQRNNRTNIEEQVVENNDTPSSEEDKD